MIRRVNDSWPLARSSASAWSLVRANSELTQHEPVQGLAQGSPPSAVLAQLFLETIEADHENAI